MPKPRALAEIDTVRRAPAVQTARALAPQGFARAEQLRTSAEAAYREGDLAGAQILSEHAIAAYQHAVILSRLVTARRRVQKAEGAIAQAQLELGRLEADQQRVAAEANNLEVRARVLRDSVPLAASRRSTPQREEARRDAARALSVQARLLCAATRLLAPQTDKLESTLLALDALDAKLAQSSASGPIDEAIRLRTECLQHLTVVRRIITRQSPADSAKADELLSELSRVGGYLPYRDDRGVVITLRAVFGAGGKLTAKAKEQLTALGKVARTHPIFPLLVVLHAARGLPGPRDRARAKLVADALVGGSKIQTEVRAVGGSQPLVDPQAPRAAT
ncbi:hypothetical protein ACFL5O_04580, partial [Myxococcota bacterium]